VSPLSDVFVHELGGTADITVRLTSPPASDVTCTAESSLDNASVAPVMVTLSAQNWLLGQRFTVTGEQDGVAAGALLVRLTVTCSSLDPTYGGFSPTTVDGIVIDTDSAAVAVSRTQITSVENGVMETFTVTLTTMPESEVRLQLGTSPPGRGSVLPTAVTFLAGVMPQQATIQVSSLQNDDEEGFATWSITPTFEARGTDYQNVVLPVVIVTVVDNDVAATVVNDAASIVLPEQDGIVIRNVRLATRPQRLVRVDLTYDFPSKVTIMPNSLIFDGTDWSTPKAFTITAVNDSVDDGDKQGMLRLGTSRSEDPSYRALMAVEVPLLVTDNDQAGVVVSAPDTTTAESVLTDTGSVRVRLATQPISPVLIKVAVSDTQEALPTVLTLAFNPSNWSAEQVITVHGLQDFVCDGDQTFDVTLAPAVSRDDAYSGRDATDTSMTNRENARRIFVTELVNTGALGGTAGADAACMSARPQEITLDAHALLASGDARRAAVVGEPGEGQVDWVLNPHTTYCRTDGTTVFTTNRFGLFHSGDQPGAIAEMDAVAWTGLEPDWTTAAATCGGWMSASDGSQGGTGNAGSSSAAGIAAGPRSCDAMLGLICVEQ